MDADMTNCAPPELSVPPVRDRSTRMPLCALQLNGAVPMFRSTNPRDGGLNGPPTGPVEVKLPEGVTRKSSGGSKFSITPDVVELEGDTALKPMPRLMNAAHNSARLA